MTGLPRPAMTPVAERPPEMVELEISHPRPFICRLVVSPAELGEVVDHVSNVEYVRWLDRAAELHADSLGYTRAFMIERGWMWFVGRHEIDYRAECWLGDEILLATWVRDMGRIKSWRDTVAWRPADGTVVMRASTLWVFVDLATRRPQRISADVAARFDPLIPREGAPCGSG